VTATPSATPSVPPSATAGLALAVADPATFATLIEPLADILKACVDGGAGVHFFAPLDRARAVAFWRATEPAIRSGARRLYYAERDGRMVGTVQLVLDQPENGPHRAEVSKMLVHPDARRQGVARALLAFAEADARREGRSLLLLDTVADSPAERLYRAVGFAVCGHIADFARRRDGSPVTTTYMYKVLAGAEPTIRRADPAEPAAAALLDALSSVLERLTGSSGRDGYAAAEATDPRGAFLLAESDGHAVGCGALRPARDVDGGAGTGADADTGEIKRMYAAPGTRGVGVRLLAGLEAEARRLGYRRLVLETRYVNRRAVAFYIRNGYLPRPPYGRYVGRPECACFEKTL
jgi:GNAT superfamily N-acetyltransferase